MGGSVLQTTQERGKLVVKDGWLICPVCRRGKLLHAEYETQAVNLELWCRKCGSTVKVNIERGLRARRLSPV